MPIYKHFELYTLYYIIILLHLENTQSNQNFQFQIDPATETG